MGDENEGAVAEAASACHDDDRNETFDGIEAGGSFSCDFGLDAGPLDQVAAQIERDRMYMSARPGLITKRLPIGMDPASGALLSGGRYLFDTYAHALAYKDWVENGYVFDGTLFLERPIFTNPECHAWKILGLHETAPLETSQIVMRTERWHVTSNGAENHLRAKWPSIRDAAVAHGYTSVWLTFSEPEHLMQLVYFAPRVAPAASDAPDLASLGALAGAPALGENFVLPHWTKTFDRTQWVLTDWYPFASGDRGRPSLWPNSPPFPAPACGDGVCEVSRGESAKSCAADCPAKCGDGICQAGENKHNCPGDCR